MILAGLALAPASFAGEQPVTVTETPVEVASRFDTQPFSITFKAGLMHTNVGTFGNVAGGHLSKLQNVPSILYGGSIGVNWNLMQAWGWDHTLGFSVGSYTGNETSAQEGIYTYVQSMDIDVWAMPLTVSYDLKKDITDSLSVYWGVRSGAMIRRTIANGYSKDDENKSERYWNDADSTKILPMVGLGAGVQMYISDQWSISLSYDFVWTFGRDCDRLGATSGSEGYQRWRLKEVSSTNRYYGTVSFGTSYSF